MGADNTKNSNVHFSPLDEREQKSRLQRFLDQGSTSLQAWVKGQNNRETFALVSFSEDGKVLSLKSHAESSSLVEKMVLFHFTMNGVDYFSNGKFSSAGRPQMYRFEFSGPLYKCERRKSFRLFVQYTHDVKVLINLAQTQSNGSNGKSGNLLDFSKNKTPGQTEIFKEFLSMVTPSQEIGLSNSILSARVIDISISGIAFMVAATNAAELVKDKVFYDVKVLFNGVEYRFSKARIVYVRDMPPQGDRKFPGTMKVAMTYEGSLSEESEQKLAMQINKELKGANYQDDFEKFI